MACRFRRAIDNHRWGTGGGSVCCRVAPNSRDILGDRFGDKALCKSVPTALVSLSTGKIGAGYEAAIDEIEAYPQVRQTRNLPAQSHKTPFDVWTKSRSAPRRQIQSDAPRGPRVVHYHGFSRTCAPLQNRFYATDFMWRSRERFSCRCYERQTVRLLRWRCRGPRCSSHAYFR